MMLARVTGVCRGNEDRAGCGSAAALAAAALLLAGCGGSDGERGRHASADTSKLTVWMMGEGGDAQTAVPRRCRDGVQDRSTPTPTWSCSTSRGSRRRRSSRRRSPAVRAPTSPSSATPRPRAGRPGGARRRHRTGCGGWAEGKDILPDLVKNAQLDGKQYGVPWYAGVRAIYYRTDWFTEAGVQPPKTWDELVTVAKAVQAKKHEHVRHRAAGQLRAAVLLVPVGRRRGDRHR